MDLRRWLPGADLLPASEPQQRTEPQTPPPADMEAGDGRAANSAPSEAASATPGAKQPDPFAAHLENVTVTDLPGDDETPPPAGGAPMASAEVLPKAAWVAGAIQLFQVPAHLPFEGLQFRSFEISKVEQPAAHEAFGALYDIAEETAFLRWLIAPDGVWAKRIVAIGLFAVPKGLAIVGEFSEKREAARAAKKAAQRDQGAPEAPAPKKAPAPASGPENGAEPGGQVILGFEHSAAAGNLAGFDEFPEAA